MIYFLTIILQKVELQIANTPGFLRGFEVAPTSKLCSQDTFFPQIEIKHHRFSKTIHMRVLKNVIHSTSAGWPQYPPSPPGLYVYQMLLPESMFFRILSFFQKNMSSGGAAGR